MDLGRGVGDRFEVPGRGLGSLGLSSGSPGTDQPTQVVLTRPTRRGERPDLKASASAAGPLKLEDLWI